MEYTFGSAGDAKLIDLVKAKQDMFQTLDKFHKAYVFRCAFDLLEKEYSDDELNIIMDLADCAYMKSEDLSLTQAADGIVQLLNNGSYSLQELEDLSKWDLIGAIGLQICAW